MNLPSLRYPAPVEAAPVTEWAADWRKRWFRHVGSVHRHHATHELVAFYSDECPPTVRLALQGELERRPSGIAQVLAVVCAETAAFDRMIDLASRHGTGAGGD